MLFLGILSPLRGSRFYPSGGKNVQLTNVCYSYSVHQILILEGCQDVKECYRSKE